jgi:transcriptional regulator with XRE-family HTH domain
LNYFENNKIILVEGDDNLKTGDRIKELRKISNLTQLELAKKLNITDKAISKWESNLGEPSIEMLLQLSKLFDVSIDYLLTGVNREKIITMSEFERIAYEDNPDLIQKLSWSLDSPDNKGFTLAEYIYKYESKKCFVHMAKGQFSRLLLDNYSNKNFFTDFFKMSLITNHFDLLKSNIRSPFAPLHKIDIVDASKETKNNRIPAVDVSIIDFILNSKQMNEKAWNFLLDTDSLYWGKGITKILEIAVKEKHPAVKRILDVIEPHNQKIQKLLKNEYNEIYNDNDNYSLRENILYNNKRYNKYEKPLLFTEVTKETVLYAMEHNDYKLADRLNQLSGYKVSDHEIKMDKINKDNSISKKDKLKSSVIYNGLVHIKELIALDDYDLYKELIEYPASEHERLISIAEKEDYKLLFEYAIQMDLNNTIETLRNNRVVKIYESLEKDFKNLRYEPNAKYLYPNKNDKVIYTNFNKKAQIDKRKIEFKEIIQSKDYRFFEHAAKYDPEHLDWSLEKIIETRPEEYRLQKILLDLGAKLHKRWVEDDGWGYNINRDVIDNTATEILKNQIKILLKEDNKNE